MTCLFDRDLLGLALQVPFLGTHQDAWSPDRHGALSFPVAELSTAERNC